MYQTTRYRAPEYHRPNLQALPQEYYGLTNLHLRYTKICDYGNFEFGAFQLGLENLVTCHFELIYVESIQ